MLRELLPLCAEVVFTQSANPRALPAGTLESLAGQVGGPPARTVAGPAARARRGAREPPGPDGVVAGHRLDLPHRRPAAPGRGAREVDAVNDDGPSDARDDRPGGRRRGRRDPRVLRARDTDSAGCSSNVPGHHAALGRLRDRQRRPEHGRQAARSSSSSSSGWRWSTGRSPTPAAGSRDPMLVGCATLASLLFPFVGTIVYMIVRPPEYLEDVRERELEMQAAEARLQQLGYLAVPALRPRGREGLPALPELPAQAQGPVRELRQAARPAVADLPVLRGRGPRARDRCRRRRRRRQRDQRGRRRAPTASYEAPPLAVTH